MKRLYNAICSLIEAKAQATTNPAPEPEPQMEGSYSQAEQAGVFEPHELHAANSHDSIDNDYGARIGFTPGSLAEAFGTSTPPPPTKLPRRKRGW